MLFWFLLIVWCLFFSMILFGVVVAIISGGRSGGEYIGIGSMLSLFSGLFTILPCAIVWDTHADDLGTIRAQHQVIQVQSERVLRLTDRLIDLQYPRGSAVFNGDSPIASIVASLTAAEDALAKAESVEAEARVNIERRAAGPMSGVVTIFGRE